MNKYLVFVFIATALISSAPIFSQLGVPNKGVWVFSFFTIFSATVSIMVYAMIQHKKLKFSREFIMPSLINFVGVVLFFYSFVYISGVTVGFLSQSQLVFTLILSYFFLHELFSAKKLVASLLVILGGFIIYYQESLNFSQIGVIMIVASMVFFSLYNYFAKKLRDRYDSLSITFYKTLITSGLLFIPCVLFFKTQLLTVDVSNLFAFVQGFTADFVGWTVFTYSLKHLKMNKAFIIYTLSSVFTLIYSFIIFGVNVVPFQLIGGLLIVSGNLFFNE